MTHPPSPLPAPLFPGTPATYRPPQVRDLGPWKTMTLLYSLPIGPGGPNGNPNGPLF